MPRRDVRRTRDAEELCVQINTAEHVKDSLKHVYPKRPDNSG